MVLISNQVVIVTPRKEGPCQEAERFSELRGYSGWEISSLLRRDDQAMECIVLERS